VRVNATPRRSRAIATLIIAGLAAWLGPVVGAADARPHRSGPPAIRCLVPGTHRTIDQLWRPDTDAAIAYARRRVGDITFAVRTPDRFYGYRADHQEWSASVVKAMLLVSYLDQPFMRERALTDADRKILGPMIRVSDNDDAQIVFDTVGQSGLRTLADRVGMTHFATNSVWGATDITARDQTRFFLHIDRFVAIRHRSYAMRLLRSISPADRWGIGQVAPRGWRLYFKGGWGYATGLLDHQAVLLVRGCARISLAVLTMYDGSHAYGKATLRGIFTRLLTRFPARFRARRVSADPPGAGRAIRDADRHDVTDGGDRSRRRAEHPRSSCNGQTGARWTYADSRRVCSPRS
jgi:hypothetical protein